MVNTNPMSMNILATGGASNFDSWVQISNFYIFPTFSCAIRNFYLIFLKNFESSHFPSPTRRVCQNITFQALCASICSLFPECSKSWNICATLVVIQIEIRKSTIIELTRQFSNFKEIVGMYK